MLNMLRFFFMLLAKGWRSGYDFISITNRRFCNSPNKIIGWHKGFPSYYLMSPPLMSSPASNSLATRIMSIYQWRRLPDLVSIAVTDRCNCSCEYCSFTSMKKNSKPLNTDEYKSVIRQAQQLGVATVNLVGGEPLMRDDICDIIASVDKELSQVTMFTNGFFLKERARDLRKSGLTSVIVSIDSADPAVHDRGKGMDGLFERALSGIAEARRQKLLAGMSCVVKRDDIYDGSLVKLFDLAKKLKVNDMMIFDSIPTGNYSAKKETAFSQSELDDLINLCAAYQQRKDYPGIHPYAYSKSSAGIGCAGGVSQFYVSPYGDVCMCDFNPMSTGSVRNEPLHVLWDRFTEKGIMCSSLSGCRVKAGSAVKINAAKGARRD